MDNINIAYDLTAPQYCDLCLERIDSGNPQIVIDSILGRHALHMCVKCAQEVGRKLSQKIDE